MVLSVGSMRTRPAPEIVYELDRERIIRTGASSTSIASELGTQARGSRAGYFREEGREIPIQVRNVREQFQNRQDLFNLELARLEEQDRKSTRLNSSHVASSYAVFCLK